MITRISKIARLPKHIREQLNQRLENGEIGRTILPWLNNLPETKAVLAELFHAKPVTHQNLSEWRRAGYQDWLFHQQRLQWFDHLTEQETELEKNKCGDAYETVGWHFLFEIGQGLAELQNIKNTDRRFARLQTLTREFARLQNAFNWSCCVQLEWDKYNDKRPSPQQPAPQLEEENEIEEEEEADLAENNIEKTIDVEELDAVALEVPPSPQLTEAPEPDPLGAPASRWPVNESPSPIAISLENANTQIAFQTIPPPAPTTPSRPTLNPQPPRPHQPHVPIRGRRFTCVEG